VIIHPNTGYYTDVRYEYRVRSIATAEAATRAMLPQIRAAIARSGTAMPVASCDGLAPGRAGHASYGETS
jgi:hypothetical protein